MDKLKIHGPKDVQDMLLQFIHNYSLDLMFFIFLLLFLNNSRILHVSILSSVSYCDDLFEQYSDDDEKSENDGETKHISVKQLLKTLKNKCKAALTWNQLQLNRGVNFDRQT